MTATILKQLWFDYCNDRFKNMGIEPSLGVLLSETALEIEKALGDELSDQVDNLMCEQCSNSEMHGFINGIKLGFQFCQEINKDD